MLLCRYIVPIFPMDAMGHSNLHYGRRAQLVGRSRPLSSPDQFGLLHLQRFLDEGIPVMKGWFDGLSWDWKVIGKKNGWLIHPGRLTWNLRVFIPGISENPLPNHHSQIPAVNLRGCSPTYHLKQSALKK